MFEKEGFEKFYCSIGGTVNEYQDYALGLSDIEKQFKTDIDVQYRKDNCEALIAEMMCCKQQQINAGADVHEIDNYIYYIQKYIVYMEQKESFSWIPFYQELADKLLVFKENRQQLISLMKQVYERTSLNFSLTEGGKVLEDVCPFTIFGCFNRGIKNENRTALASAIAEIFHLNSDVPYVFDGIPVLNNMNAMFFAPKNRRKNTDIEHLWSVFEAAIQYADNKNDTYKNKFIDCYNQVITQPGVKWNLTMGLYWIRPYTYLNLDEKNRIYLTQDIAFKNEDEITFTFELKTVPDGGTYMTMIETCLAMMEKDSSIQNFPMLSRAAWFNAVSTSAYIPPLSEYDPHITKEMWADLLRDKSVFSDKMLVVMKMYMEQNGESTCDRLSEIYGNTPAYYNMMGSNLADAVKARTNCPVRFDDTNKERFWPIPFIGRDITENGKKRFSWRLRSELYAALNEFDLDDIIIKKSGETKTMNSIGLNTILYGPPGTGKTYYTVIYAVAIIEKKSIDEVSAENYADVLQSYYHYKNLGLIEFITFHQSYGYEEFIEGIKPMIDADESPDIKYTVEKGVFREFCETSELVSVAHDNKKYGLNDNPVIWKVSLDGTYDNPIRKECLEHDHIRIGWDAYGKNITDEMNFIHGGKTVLNAFINSMQIGDIVLSCYSEKVIDAIGVVTGEYQWEDSFERLKRVRAVKWLVKNIRHDIYKLNNKINMTLSTVYRMNNISLSDIIKIIDNNSTVTDDSKNRVFIIDEINRGNISKIFGELITLIEPSKRLGEAEEMKVRLPYSKKMFGIPNHIYLLGTMNTADRSIALLDTALRRRFTFVEMQPDPSVLSGICIDGVEMDAVLSKMNQRIEVLYDREHTIGHAYFLPLKTKPTLECLAKLFAERILPLLQEYFYEDYEKIRLVLGDNNKEHESEQFVIKRSFSYDLFGTAEYDIDIQAIYEINHSAFTKIEAYQAI